jgi:hypothetical protein
MTDTTDTPRDRADHPRSICLTLLLIAMLVSASAAVAAPTATLKVKALPIPGFPGTGNILNAGMEVETQVTISGTEYDGFPSPLTGLNVYAPSGIKITTKGFATCATTVLEQIGPTGCPAHSSAGPPGIGFGVVAFGGDEVPETVSIKSFFTPASGPTFYVEGSTPASFQILEPSHWTTATAPFGDELVIAIPLVETDPGGNDASVTGFKVKIGAAYKKGRKTVSYITTPKKCPKAGFPIKMEMKFLSGETTTVDDTVPCPKK